MKARVPGVIMELLPSTRKEKDVTGVQILVPSINAMVYQSGEKKNVLIKDIPEQVYAQGDILDPGPLCKIFPWAGNNGLADNSCTFLEK